MPPDNESDDGGDGAEAGGPVSPAAAIADWLAARGWVRESNRWCDPLHHGAPEGIEDDASLHIDSAATIQRARDASDERKAWVAFAAGLLMSPAEAHVADVVEHIELVCVGTGVIADRMLTEYRKRFAIEAAK